MTEVAYRKCHVVAASGVGNKSLYIRMYYIFEASSEEIAEAVALIRWRKEEEVAKLDPLILSSKEVYVSNSHS